MIRAPGIELEETCFACPQQYQGTVDGNPAFFRLRHSSWRFCIVEPGGNPVGPGATPDKKVLYYKDGEHEPGTDAGIMVGAEGFILAMIEDFRREQTRKIRMVLYTRHLPDHGEVSATWAGRVRPEDLDPEEIAGIKDGTLGYCEAHKVLYRKWALHSCLVPSIFEEHPRTECKEWEADPRGTP